MQGHFIGLRMLLGDIIQIPVRIALGIVGAILLISIVISLLRARASSPVSPHTDEARHD